MNKLALAFALAVLGILGVTALQIVFSIANSAKPAPAHPIRELVIHVLPGQEIPAYKGEFDVVRVELDRPQVATPAPVVKLVTAPPTVVPNCVFNAASAPTPAISFKKVGETAKKVTPSIKK